MIESNENVAIPSILKSSKLLSLLNFEWDMKFYFLHMKSDEVGTTLKHSETINGNVKNLSKRMKMKDKENVTFTLSFIFILLLQEFNITITPVLRMQLYSNIKYK